MAIIAGRPVDDDELEIRKDGHIRSVERTLIILAAMNRVPVSTIESLHMVTGLPKPTLVRFLKTMTNMGYVTHNPEHSGYQLTSLVTSLSSGYHGDPLIVEAARPWAVQLTRRLKWPISIAVLSGHWVVVRLSTVAESPISPFHATINMKLGLFSRGLGKAYMAFLSDEQIEAFAREVELEEPEEAVYVKDRDALWDHVALLRKQGYALRDFRAEPNTSNTLAVPIFLDGQVRATIGITFFRSVVRTRAELEEFAAVLTETSAQISQETMRLKRSKKGLSPEAQGDIC